jgi:SNF2 family DNA or RNA helicase
MKQRLERFIEQQKQKRMNHESDSSESDIPPVPTTETSQIPGSGVETDIDTDDEKIETLQLLQDIMRLRQFCDHPATVQAVLEEYFTNEDKKEFIEKVAIFENPSYRSTAQQMLLNMRNRLTEIGDKTHKLLIEEDTSIDDTPTQVLIWDHTTCGQPPSESDRYTELRRETGGVHGKLPP